MLNIRKYLHSELAKAAQKIIPGCEECLSLITEKHKPWHYASPSAIQLYNKYVKVRYFYHKYVSIYWFI